MRSNHYTMVARSLILQTLRSASIGDNSPVGVAVSGGADSSALLLGLASIYRGPRAQLVHVLTVDHQLQAETALIAESVASFSRSLGFQAHTVAVNIEATGSGMESDARDARYEVLEALTAEHNLSAVLLGHTKNDQAEQVLLGLLRGSGTRSLSAMAQVRGNFLRPFLLGLSREETQLVCAEAGYSYWNDPHNELKRYRRVALRKLLASVEEETGESLIDPLVRSSQISREDSEALDLLAERAEPKILASGWSVEALLREPAAIRKRLYRRALLQSGAPTDGISFEILNRIEDLTVNWHGQGAVAVGNSVRVSRVAGTMIFS